ncbi:hypothetical protein RDABS01_000047 [Bienertia sinuspersici]
MEQGDWNKELIAEVFEERDAKCILAIPLSERLPRDELIWAFSKDGDYSVKTACMIGKGCDLDLFHQAWVDIWAVNASPKVRHFLWRMCTESIPVRGLLKERHITDVASCPWCKTHKESTQHALFECTRAREIWEACDCQMLLEDGADMSLCDQFVQWKKYGEEARALGGYIVFEDITTPTTVIGQRIRSQVDEYGNYASFLYSSTVHQVSSNSKVWQPPPCDIVKLNVDASIDEAGWVGFGVVARTHEGKVVFAATRRNKARWTPEVAEAKALVYAVKLGRDFGITKAMVESDCLTIISRLSKGATHLTELDTVLGDILQLSSSFACMTWSHINREGNYVAHHLARIIPLHCEKIWEDNVPPEVAPYLLMDSLLVD